MSVSGVMRKPWVFRALHTISAFCAVYAVVRAIVHPETVTKWDVIVANAILIAWNVCAYTLRRFTDQLMGMLEDTSTALGTIADRLRNEAAMSRAAAALASSHLDLPPIGTPVNVPKPKGEN